MLDLITFLAGIGAYWIFQHINDHFRNIREDKEKLRKLQLTLADLLMHNAMIKVFGVALSGSPDDQNLKKCCWSNSALATVWKP